MTYNQIRFVKASLATVLVGFGIFVAYQLYRSFEKRQSPADVPLPVERQDLMAREVEITRLGPDGERDFVLRAAESTGRTEALQTFRDVEIEFVAGKERVPLTITADRCEFNSTSAKAHLQGNVVIRDRKSLRVETSVLDYAGESSRVWTDESVRFYRDRLEGQAGSLEYDVPGATFFLENGVSMTLHGEGERPASLVSQSGLFRRPSSLMQFVDDVVLTQGENRLSCNDLLVFLRENEQGMERVEAYQDVNLLMGAPRVEGDSGPVHDDSSRRSSEDTARVTIEGQTGRRRLSTDKLEMTFREDGATLERARALDGGKLVLEPQSRPGEKPVTQELEGNLIAFDFDAEGRLTELRARGGTTLRMGPVGAPPERMRILNARELEATFDPATGDLKQARWRRNVDFSHEDVRGEAQAGVYDPGAERITLTGSPRLRDSRGRLAAATILIDAASGDLEATGAVQSTVQGDSSRDQAGLFRSPTGEPVHFVAERLRYRSADDLAVYTGSARAFQEENRIEAEEIALRQESGELEATGSVRTVLAHASERGPQRTVTRAASLTYRPEEQVLRYRRDVEMASDTITLRGQKVDVTLGGDGNEVQEVLAEENVEILTEDGKAGGDHAKYLPKTEEVRVTGDKAHIQDGDKLTEGKELTFFLSSDKIFVDGRELSRTKTIYTSKPRPM